MKTEISGCTWLPEDLKICFLPARKVLLSPNCAGMSWFSPINKRERKCFLPCSPNGHNLHVQCCCQRDAVWWEHQHIRKETKVHISGWNTAGQIQTLICLVPFDSWLHLVTATSHKVDGKNHLAADTIRIQYSRYIKDYEWRRDSRRKKYFIFPREWLTMKAQTHSRETLCEL